MAQPQGRSSVGGGQGAAAARSPPGQQQRQQQPPPPAHGGSLNSFSYKGNGIYSPSSGTYEQLQAKVVRAFIPSLSREDAPRSRPGSSPPPLLNPRFLP